MFLHKGENKRFIKLDIIYHLGVLLTIWHLFNPYHGILLSYEFVLWVKVVSCSNLPLFVEIQLAFSLKGLEPVCPDRNQEVRMEVEFD